MLAIFGQIIQGRCARMLTHQEEQLCLAFPCHGAQRHIGMACWADGRDVYNQKEPSLGHLLPLVLPSAPGVTEASILACFERSGSFAEDDLIFLLLQQLYPKLEGTKEH